MSRCIQDGLTDSPQDEESVKNAAATLFAGGADTVRTGSLATENQHYDIAHSWGVTDRYSFDYILSCGYSLPYRFTTCSRGSRQGNRDRKAPKLSRQERPDVYKRNSKGGIEMGKRNSYG